MAIVIMSQPIYLYIAIGLGVTTLLLAVWVLILELRLRKLFKGKSGRDLEEVISSIRKELSKTNITVEEIEKYLKTAEVRIQKSVQKIGLVRFNPFENTGSNQSFAISLLDEKNDGIVISSLYSRDKMGVYAKPIVNGKSEYSLSEEEEEAIEQAE
jgi:hypothetical protein